ncbi:alpha/beta hydrolase [Mycobacterium sp. SM1]|uniref:alpha/beta fold hydrolase n=1 Tax=Mycobacterium sp. SM1 TaxID=2816243 RepID=UPI001BCFF68C|nr:alpha/beta hydrolase [Mycobacterium sp. SM1]MBS4729533.1 alpha/beta hydrolase [Mycobacterium sp. SM1]
MNIPPYEIFAENLFTYPQIKRSFYFWYFQMRHVIEDRVRQNDFEFIRDIWGDWSPGYQADEDLVHVREALAEPACLRTALGYYWAQFDPTEFGSAQWAAEQEAAWGGTVGQPLLYLHGTTDGCYGVTAEQITRIPGYGGTDSAAELIPGVGHFMLVERPNDINEKILSWLQRTGKTHAAD